MKRKKKITPKFIIVKDPDEPAAWFNPYIGQKFEVLDISAYDYVKVCYDKELKSYGWIPLIYCQPHLQVV